jgi:hypothetical protein
MKWSALLLVLAFGSRPAAAQETPEILDFDANGDGRIEASEATPEFFQFINKVFMPVLGAEERVVTAPTASSASVKDDKAAVDQAVQALAAESVVVEQKKSRITRKWLLRRKVEDVSLSQNAVALDAADGAVVSYINDFKQDTEQWQIQGALLYPIRYGTGRDISAGTRVLSAYTFVPSVSFDRKFHSTDTAAEIDTLAVRLGSEWEVAGGRILPRQYFRASPVYATDFDFKSAVIAGELQYEALRESWGLGAPRSCLWRNFNCQWRAILHLEGGKTLDPGDKANLTEDEEFLRLGPKLNATIQPTYQYFSRLELKLSWFYLEELLEGEGASDLFESALSWRLDDRGHLRLRAQYRNGDLPLTRDKVSIFTTGLEVKF